MCMCYLLPSRTISVALLQARGAYVCGERVPEKSSAERSVLACLHQLAAQRSE